MIIEKVTLGCVCIRMWMCWGVFIRLRVMFWTAIDVGWLGSLRVVDWEVSSFTWDIGSFTWAVWTLLSELLENETSLIVSWVGANTERTFCRELRRFYAEWCWVVVAAFDAFRRVCAVGSGMAIGLTVKALRYFPFFMWFFNFDYCMQ